MVAKSTHPKVSLRVSSSLRSPSVDEYGSTLLDRDELELLLLVLEEPYKSKAAINRVTRRHVHETGFDGFTRAT
jgi:hypothetical protein